MNNVSIKQSDETIKEKSINNTIDNSILGDGRQNIIQTQVVSLRRLFVSYALWKNEKYKYNTVANTTGCFSFWWMQMIRVVLLVLIILELIFFFFIFFKSAPGFINFWALLLSFLSCIYLFIGSGIEVCLQKQIESGTQKDRLLKSKLWVRGVIFYMQAIPFVVTSNVLFWTP